MSYAISVEAWKVRIDAGAKLVLISLADQAKDSGECFPSANYIENRTCLSRSSIFRHLNTLEQAGHITRKQRLGQSTIYLVHPNKDAQTRVNLTLPTTIDPSQIGTPVVSNWHPSSATVAPIICKESINNLSIQKTDDETLPISTETAKASTAPSMPNQSVKAEEAESPKRVRHNGGIQASEAFNKFWDAFPDHRNKGAKSAAATVWKRKKFDSMLDRILADIQKQQQSNPAWQVDKKGLDYIQAGHNYLKDLDADSLPNPNRPYPREINAGGDLIVWHMRPDQSLYPSAYGRNDPEDLMIADNLSLWRVDKNAENNQSMVTLDIDMAAVWERHLAAKRAV